MSFAAQERGMSCLLSKKKKTKPMEFTVFCRKCGCSCSLCLPLSPPVSEMSKLLPLAELRSWA